MAVTVSGTNIVFNDATTQTTAWTGSAGGVTSAVAGNGVAVSGATGAVTFSQACPTASSVGSYTLVSCDYASSCINGTNSAGSLFNVPPMAFGGCNNSLSLITIGSTLSGTWKWMSATYNQAGYKQFGIICRVS